VSTFSYSEYDRWAKLAVEDPELYRRESFREAKAQVVREREQRVKTAFRLGRKVRRRRVS